MNNETALVVTLVLLITLLVVVVFVLYRKFRQGNDSSTTFAELQVEKKKNRKTLKAMYTPQPVGVPTGHKRLFQTNKGLRVYDTNEKGWPLPKNPVEISSQ